MHDESATESGGIAAAMMFLGENPTEFNVFLIEIGAGAKPREADGFISRFQAHRLVTKSVAESEMLVNEPLSLILAKGALIEYKLHQIGMAENCDERRTVTMVIGSKHNVPGI